RPSAAREIPCACRLPLLIVAPGAMARWNRKRQIGANTPHGPPIFLKSSRRKLDAAVALGGNLGVVIGLDRAGEAVDIAGAEVAADQDLAHRRVDDDDLAHGAP